MNAKARWARPPVGPSLLLSAAVLWSAGCETAPAVHVDDRTFTDIGEFVSDYWRRPIPLQGDAPDSFNPLEASFEPATCGTCHPRQFEDWQTTIHGGAYSPGLSGQLIDQERNNYGFVRSCLICHAPLSEQSAMITDSAGALVRNPHFDRSLQKQGMVCAGCHFRGWRKYGPPRRDGSLAPSPEGSPQGGVIRTPFFEDSRFCSGCHQFAAPAANGKSLQNTYVEWERSKYPALGTHCQNCHMPDRRHLWRGIHDSTMVADGVSIGWERTGPEAVSFRVTNTGVGHRFPTYVTPEVEVRLELLDADGAPIVGGGVVEIIGRNVYNSAGQWLENFDTRLAPDSSMTVTARPTPEARYARGIVTVVPDKFYEGVFRALLSQQRSDSSRVVLSEAHRRAGSSPFVIFDDTVTVGGR